MSYWFIVFWTLWSSIRRTYITWAENSPSDGFDWIHSNVTDNNHQRPVFLNLATGVIRFCWFGGGTPMTPNKKKDFPQWKFLQNYWFIAEGKKKLTFKDFKSCILKPLENGWNRRLWAYSDPNKSGISRWMPWVFLCCENDDLISASSQIRWKKDGVFRHGSPGRSWSPRWPQIILSGR